MKTINFLFLIFLILGALVSTSLSSRLRKFDSSSKANSDEFLEEASDENVEADLDAEDSNILEAHRRTYRF